MGFVFLFLKGNWRFAMKDAVGLCMCTMSRSVDHA